MRMHACVGGLCAHACMCRAFVYILVKLIPKQNHYYLANKCWHYNEVLIRTENAFATPTVFSVSVHCLASVASAVTRTIFFTLIVVLGVVGHDLTLLNTLEYMSS